MTIDLGEYDPVAALPVLTSLLCGLTWPRRALLARVFDIHGLEGSGLRFCDSKSVEEPPLFSSRMGTNFQFAFFNLQFAMLITPPLTQ